MLLAHQQCGELGEALALAKLTAYSSPAGAPGHDLLVVVDGKPLSVEVKTRQHDACPKVVGRWPVNMATKGGADLFIFVELNISTMTPTFYVLTNAQARSCWTATSGGNCKPSHVRKIAVPNSFDALTA